MSSSQQAVHLEKLNPAHQAHVNGYLKYFRRRLTASQNEISHAFHDAKEINLTESVYTADEVKEKMESLYTTVKAEIQTEFERYAHQSVLFLCLIFLQAEAQGFSVSIDTSSLDDAQLLDALKNFEVGPRLDIANKKLACTSREPLDMTKLFLPASLLIILLCVPHFILCAQRLTARLTRTSSCASRTLSLKRRRCSVA